MKWLLSLVTVTLLFLVTSFFIPQQDAFSFRWMTLGVALVAFIQYYIVWKSNRQNSQKMIGGHMAGIVLKFILSAFVVILYIIFFEVKGDYTAYVYYFVALLLYSVINYVGSYYS